MVIRLAAIDAVRRVPCQTSDRADLLSYFRDARHDTELRIAAYLAAMRCPTPRFLDEIKHALVNEQVNQGTPPAQTTMPHLHEINHTRDLLPYQTFLDITERIP